MSIRLLSRVWELDVTGNERAVLQVLCDYANDEGVCWPSIGSIAWKVGCSEQTVRNMMNQLYQRDALVRIEEGGGRGRSNTYRVVLSAFPTKTPREPERGPDEPFSKPYQTDLSARNPALSDAEQSESTPSQTPKTSKINPQNSPQNPQKENHQKSPQNPKPPKSECTNPQRAALGEPSVIEPSGRKGHDSTNHGASALEFSSPTIRERYAQALADAVGHRAETQVLCDAVADVFGAPIAPAFAAKLASDIGGKPQLLTLVLNQSGREIVGKPADYLAKAVERVKRERPGNVVGMPDSFWRMSPAERQSYINRTSNGF